jgi:hypothetical protein
MKTLIVTLATACVVVAGYFGVRYFARRDLGFTPARNYVKNLAENVRHKLTAAHEAGSTANTTTEQAASL